MVAETKPTSCKQLIPQKSQKPVGFSLIFLLGTWNLSNSKVCVPSTPTPTPLLPLHPLDSPVTNGTLPMGRVCALVYKGLSMHTLAHYLDSLRICGIKEGVYET